MEQQNGVPTASTVLKPGVPDTLPQLFPTQQIEEIVRRIVEETRLTNQTTEFVDETFSDTSNLADLDKTPHIVKAIRNFDGNPTEYTAWRKSAERIFKLYDNLKGTAKYYGILTVVRSKITGQANTALESYNTPLNWTAIKQCLNTHYADKRDITTLEYQLTTLVQGRNSIEHFYQKVYSNFSLILNNVSGMELDKQTEDALIETYRNKALDTFIRGLNCDLPRLLAIREPKTLPEALYVCSKLANQDFRTNYAYNNQSFITPQTHFNLNRSQIRNTPNFVWPMQQHSQPMQQFPPPQYRATTPQLQQPPRFQPTQQYPPLQYRTRPLQPQQQPIRFQPTQQTAMAYAQPPPEPMDVDMSIRSQQINYANRPNHQIAEERPLTNQVSRQHPRQAQNFHVTTGESMVDVEQTPYTTSHEIPWEDYLEEYEQQQCESTNHIDVVDIYFLG